MGSELEKMMEKQKKYWQSYEDNQFLIFCGKDVNQTGMSMIFHCADERVPHKFVKEVEGRQLLV